MIKSTTAATAEPTVLQAGRLPRVAFSVAIFLAAALLFMVQPLIARMILPVLGGSPVVWIIAVAFFQITLLAGYGYAHLTARFGPRARAISHAAVLAAALLFLPLSVPAWSAPGSEPYFWLFGLLAVAVGAPFFVLAAASPSLAYWYTDGGRRDPYFLYSVSNAGSFFGLLSYPLVIEPVLGLSSQSRVWAWGFAGFALVAVWAVTIAIRAAVPRAEITDEVASSPPIGWTKRLTWIGLAFVPSSLLLGSTTFITSEVGSVPLLWVLPLAAYLLTFVIAFRDRTKPLGNWPSRLATFLVFAVLTSWSIQSASDLWLDLILHVGLLFSAGLVIHVRLYNTRPAPARLTEFYLLLSLGGALGGVFNAFVAPLMFNWAVEYPIVIVAATALLASRSAQPVRSPRAWTPAIAAGAVALALRYFSDGASEKGTAIAAIVAIGIAAILLLSAKRSIVLAVGVGMLAVLFPPVSNGAIFRERTFFGILSVRETETERSMFHGVTLHGTQFLDERALQPGAYYARPGPLGDVFATRTGPLQAGVVGLGVGTIATYGENGDKITFFEIDSAVVDLARDDSLFTFLSSSEAEIEVRIEDGRIGLEEATEASYDLIVLDAFSADAIPVHLLTVEALEGYRQRLEEGGRIAIHISNRFFDLRPVLAGAADELGVVAMSRLDAGGPERFASRWVVIADESSLASLADRGWETLEPDPDFRIWTDDYSNPLSVLR